MKGHPNTADLALLAGGDLALWRRWTVSWHVRHCVTCAKEVAALRQLRERVRQQGLDLPPGVDWTAVEAEMKANIRLGLTAGALVGRRGRMEKAAEAWEWRSVAVVAASLAFVAIAGWMLQVPGGPAVSEDRATKAVEVNASDGLSLRSRDADLAVFGPGAKPISAAVNWDGSAGAQFLDEVTGQVTIYNVATQ